MAYVPIGKKNTGGYVPIGSKATKPVESYNELFPATQMVREATRQLPPTPKPTYTPIGQKVKEFVVPSRGFTDEQISSAKPTLKDTAIGSAKAVGEIGLGISQLTSMGLRKIPGLDKLAPTPEQTSKYNKYVEPSSPEEASVMRTADIVGLMALPSKAGKLSSLRKMIPNVSDINDARKILKSEGLTDEFIQSLKLDQKVVAAKTVQETDSVVDIIAKNVPSVDTVAKASVVAPLPRDNTVSAPVKLPDLTKSADPIGDVAKALKIDDVVTQEAVNKLQQWISFGARTTLDTSTLKTIDALNIKPTERITLYRSGDIDGSQFQSWSKVKPKFTDDITTKSFAPEEVLVDTNSPQFKALFQNDPEFAQVVEKFNVRESEVITKPSAMVVGKPELPPLPKADPEMLRALETGNADAAIRKAISERYTQVTRKPDVQDPSLSKAAASPEKPSGIKKLTGEILTPISSRLGRINPALKEALRKFEYSVASKTTQNSQEILPLLRATKRMDAQDASLFDLAMKNGDTEVLDALAVRYDMQDELNRVRDTLDDIFERAKAVGMDINYRKDYFPRSIKNPSAYMAYWRGNADWGTINELVSEYAKKKGLKYSDLTDEDMTSIINNFIRGYGDKTVLAAPNFSKGRTLNTIDEELNQFYLASNDSLQQYVIRMNDEIEGRKFFGKKAEGDTRIEDSIGGYVLDLVANGKIKPQQEKEVADILRSRFKRGTMNGALDVYRNAEYISTMGSPISAITQLGDLAFSVYENGFWQTGKAFGKAVIGTKRLTKEELGIENITQEFTKNTMSGKALDTVFRLVGLNKLDAIGKETLVNGYLGKLKNQAVANDGKLIEQLDTVFGPEETQRVLKDLASGKLTDETKYLAFNKLLDYQPVAKSEMPQKYLEMPNGRIFYTLKSFTLKQIDVFRREAIDDIVTGNASAKAKGMKNLLLLSGAFVAANATADEIKDFVLDRDTPVSDKVVDNLWRLVGASKYDVYKARSEGVGKTVQAKILFPTSLIDRFGKDVSNILSDKKYEKGSLKGEAYKLESSQSIPLAGKLYYWWFGRGAQKEEYKQGAVDETTGLPKLPKLPQVEGAELPKLPKIGG